MKAHNKIVLMSLMTMLSICAHCSAHETSCACGVPDEEDDCDHDKISKKLRHQVFSAPDDFPLNHQFCYRYKLFGSDYKTAKPEIADMPSENRTLKIDRGDENIHFSITTPNYSECYNNQEYCIARASCSREDDILILSPQSHSKLTITKSANSCIDRMQFYDGDKSFSDAFCGEDIGSNMVGYPLPDNFELHFYSSPCCQQCGSSIWLTCVPPYYPKTNFIKSPSSPAQQRIYDRLFINVWNRQMLYWVRKTLLIPDGSFVRFKHRNVIITSKNAPVNIFSGIRKLFVFDEKTKHYYLFWQESPKIFKISGVLYIGYYKAWFVATEQESPIERRTKSEDAYIEGAVEFLRPFYTPSPSPPPSMPTDFPTEDPNKQEYKPDCTMSHDRISKTCPIVKCPTRGVQLEFCIRSKKELQVSTDFLVRSFASLIIKTLTLKKPKGNSYYHRGYYDYLGKYTKYRYPSYGGYPKGPRGPQSPCLILINC